MCLSPVRKVVVIGKLVEKTAEIIMRNYYISNLD
jgi:hypothetical protein